MSHWLKGHAYMISVWPTMLKVIQHVQDAAMTGMARVRSLDMFEDGELEHLWLAAVARILDDL